jgi:DNA-binding beta-propeller fold protein YncE
MKTSIRILLLLGLFAFAAASCNKDDGNDDDGPYFKAKIDGAAYDAEGTLAYAVDFDDYLNIYGVKDQSAVEACYISVPKGTTPGTYTFDLNNHFAYYTDASATGYSSRWGQGNGSVTIEEIDATHVKGTFQFTVFDGATETVKKTFTEGSFDVEFR